MDFLETINNMQYDYCAAAGIMQSDYYVLRNLGTVGITYYGTYVMVAQQHPPVNHPVPVRSGGSTKKSLKRQAL